MKVPDLVPIVALLMLGTGWCSPPAAAQVPVALAQPPNSPATSGQNLYTPNSNNSRVVHLSPPRSPGPSVGGSPAFVPLAARPLSANPASNPAPTSLIPAAVAQAFAAGNDLPMTMAPATADVQPQVTLGKLPPLPPLPTAGLPTTPAGPASMGLGSSPAKSTLSGFSNPQASATHVQPEEFPAGRLIAVVGNEHILAGDMAVFVEPIIEQNRERIKNKDEEKKIRSQLTRQVLRQYCEIKAIYQEFFRDMVGTVPPKQLQETKEKVLAKAGRIFFERQVPVLMEKYQVTTMQDLERKLNEKSLSLTTLRSQFVEQVLASELERKYVPDKFEIDRQDLLEAYQNDKQQNLWSVAGRARWRQLTVRFDKHPTRQAAEEKIRQLGNEIFLGGKAFEAVARQSSEGYTSAEGGAYGWTTQGSLKSQPLDAALFSLPLNSLSQVIADDIGLHIIEVLEREEGHVKDFTEAQSELRDRLSDERRIKEVRAFRERILERTTIWTLWPEDIPDSRPLAEAIGPEGL